MKGAVVVGFGLEGTLTVQWSSRLANEPGYIKSKEYHCIEDPISTYKTLPLRVRSTKYPPRERKPVSESEETD